MYYKNKLVSESEVQSILNQVSEGVVNGVTESGLGWVWVEDYISKFIEVQTEVGSRYWVVVYMEITV